MRADDIPAVRRVTQYWKPALAAASLALMVGIGAVQYSLKSPVSESALATMRYDTPVGGQRLIALADGSQIELNTKTVVRPAVSKTLSRVSHANGEVFFDIALNAAHPIVLVAVPTRIPVLRPTVSVRTVATSVSLVVLTAR